MHLCFSTNYDTFIYATGLCKMVYEMGLQENGTNTTGWNHQCEGSFYSSLFGMCISMPEWEAVLTIVALGLVIIITIVGKSIALESICFC